MSQPHRNRLPYFTHTWQKGDRAWRVDDGMEGEVIGVTNRTVKVRWSYENIPATQWMRPEDLSDAPPCAGCGHPDGHRHDLCPARPGRDACADCGDPRGNGHPGCPAWDDGGSADGRYAL